MVTPGLSPQSRPNWKRFAIIGLCSGAGFALMLSAIAGMVIWYNSRPTPPKAWDAKAIVATATPGFDLTDDGKKITFRYTLENTTKRDYQLESTNDLRLMVRTKDGTLATSLAKDDGSVVLPVFIPAKQRSSVTILIAPQGIPDRKAAEPDNEYHERLRAYLEDHLSWVGSFVAFDGLMRYEIDLPRWLAERPKTP